MIWADSPLVFNFFLGNCYDQCFYLLDDIWIIILKKWSYVDLIQFGRTCKKFFALANNQKFMKRANMHQRDIFIMLIERDVTRSFCSGFDKFFKKHYTDYENILYMKYFLSVMREHLNSRFIFGHLYWCKRSPNLTSSCKFCCQVRRCFIYDKSETETRYVYALYHHQSYDQHRESIFQNDDYFSKDLNTLYKQCDYFEHIYHYNQLINFFGVIAVRIFFNFGKKDISIISFIIISNISLVGLKGCSFLFVKTLANNMLLTQLVS